MPYPWLSGDTLTAADLNNAFKSVPVGPPGPPGSLGRGFIGGLAIAPTFSLLGTPVQTIDVFSGLATDFLSTSTIVSPGVIRKSVAGTWDLGGVNGMAPGVTIAINTWYHVYIATILATTEVFFDSTFPPTHSPTGTTAYRRIGSIFVRLFNSAPFVKAFAQNNNRFDWLSPGPVTEYNAVPGVTTANTLTLAGAPPGVNTQAILCGTLQESTTINAAMYLSSIAADDVAVAFPAVTGVASSIGTSVYPFAATVTTDTASQIRMRVNTTTLAVKLATTGYIDGRGQG